MAGRAIFRETTIHLNSVPLDYVWYPKSTRMWAPRPVDKWYLLTVHQLNGSESLLITSYTHMWVRTDCTSKISITFILSCKHLVSNQHLWVWRFYSNAVWCGFVKLPLIAAWGLVSQSTNGLDSSKQWHSSSQNMNGLFCFAHLYSVELSCLTKHSKSFLVCSFCAALNRSLYWEIFYCTGMVAVNACFRLR